MPKKKKKKSFLDKLAEIDPKVLMSGAVGAFDLFQGARGKYSGGKKTLGETMRIYPQLNKDD